MWGTDRRFKAESSRRVHNSAADDGARHFAVERHSAVGAVSRTRFRLQDVVGPLLRRIEDRHVGYGALSEGSTMCKAGNARGVRRQQRYYVPNRDIVSAVQARHCRAQGDLQAGNAEGGAFELYVLFEGRVRGMIGRNGVDSAIYQACQ